MKTEHYPHKVAAIYPDAAAATAAVSALRAAELGDIEIMQLTPDSEHVGRAVEPEQEATRNTVVKDTLIGTAAGTVAGGAAAGAIAALMPALFVSAPVVGPLMVLGYGAMIGALPGAIRGFRLREGQLAGMVQDAVKGGFHVVIVHTPDEETEGKVQAVINETMSEESAHT